jgi:alpha-1,2-mannosyltransferase
MRLDFLLFAAVPTAVFALVLLVLRARVVFALKRRCHGGRKTIAFLHPFCNDGGGGERVLWVAIRELIAQGVTDPTAWRVVVYTGDSVTDDEIRHHASSRFGVTVPPAVEFVRLMTRSWIEPKRYPVATLLGQALGSLVLAAEAVARDPPHILVDTTGLHFCLPLLRLAGVPRLACYVHYPLVSSDMLGAVASRKTAHNNRGVFARFALGATLKLAYYHLLVLLYRASGRCSDATMANGSWTGAHLRALWGVEPSIVFPPCDTKQLQALPLEPPNGPRGSSRLVLSVAQFRPEKDHARQLRAFALLLRAWREAGAEGPRPELVVAGAVRHADDARRLDELRQLAAQLMPADAGLADAVRFAPNLDVAQLRELLGTAAVGLHTMWNEHFGIGVVEMLAAGVATIGHRSGGPALDIIDDGKTGMLAAEDDEYAEAMASLLIAPRAEERRARMAEAGRAAVAGRFSEAAFANALCQAMHPVVFGQVARA